MRPKRAAIHIADPLLSFILRASSGKGSVARGYADMNVEVTDGVRAAYLEIIGNLNGFTH